MCILDFQKASEKAQRQRLMVLSFQLWFLSAWGPFGCGPKNIVTQCQSISIKKAMPLSLPLGLIWKKHEKINLISSRFPCAAPQQECYMISNCLLEIFLWVSCWGLLFQSACIVRKMRCNSTCYLIPKASSTFGQKPTSKSRSGTSIFCFTLTFCHILDDKQRVGEKTLSQTICF